MKIERTVRPPNQTVLDVSPDFLAPFTGNSPG
jgi:hypothetical protein